MPPNRSARTAYWFPLLVQGLAVTNLIICVLQLLIDTASLWSTKADDAQYDSDGYLNADALTGIILLLIHVAVVLAQIYFGYCFLDSVKQRDFIGCRQWLMTSMNIYGIEFLCFLLFACFGPRAEVFVGFTTIAILYKLFQLWPIDGFIVNLETYSDPLLGEEEFHI